MQKMLQILKRSGHLSISDVGLLLDEQKLDQDTPDTILVDLLRRVEESAGHEWSRFLANKNCSDNRDNAWVTVNQEHLQEFLSIEI
jgi:hypothetical protein